MYIRLLNCFWDLHSEISGRTRVIKWRLTINTLQHENKIGKHENKSGEKGSDKGERIGETARIITSNQ